MRLWETLRSAEELCAVEPSGAPVHAFDFHQRRLLQSRFRYPAFIFILSERAYWKCCTPKWENDWENVPSPVVLRTVNIVSSVWTSEKSGIGSVVEQLLPQFLHTWGSPHRQSFAFKWASLPVAPFIMNIYEYNLWMIFCVCGWRWFLWAICWNAASCWSPIDLKTAAVY